MSLFFCRLASACSSASHAICSAYFFSIAAFASCWSRAFAWTWCRLTATPPLSTFSARRFKRSRISEARYFRFEVGLEPAWLPLALPGVGDDDGEADEMVGKEVGDS